jgi:transcriptional regulator with XRE-family HTH domain
MDPDASPLGDPATDIGIRVAAHRGRAGLKVSDLARQIGVSASLISQIERGQSRPSVSTLFAISEALEVPMDAFFRDGDSPTDERPLRLVKGDEPVRDGRHVVSGRRRPRSSWPTRWRSR